MRKIKFRTWYKGGQFPMDKNDLEDFEKPQMIYNVQKLYDGMGVDKNPVLGGYGCFDSLLDDEEFEVMQYIGIKDKNKNEVYENDIVKKDIYIGVVTYREDLCRYVIRFKDGTSEIISAYGAFEVLGNIYENLELLEELQ